jgi:MFS transporter, DHA3 family, macrolide efflux protein
MTDLAQSVAPKSGFRSYLIIWAGQFASMLGSNLTSFALAVYVFRLTDSATTLGIILALGLLPAAVASPFAGSLVDRWGTRRTLLISGIGSMLITLTLAPLLATDTFRVWQVYIIVMVTSILTALQVPALGALTPQLVPKEQLGQANGLRMVAIAVSQVLAPVTAGFLFLAIGLTGIVIMDVISYGAAIVTVYLVRVPHQRSAPAADERKSTLLSEFGEGWRFVTARRGLLTLLFFLASVNFSAGFIELLISPLVLSFASSKALGIVLSTGGVGMIIAGVAVSVSGGPRRRVRAVFMFALLFAVAAIAGALRPNVALVACAAFFAMGALVLINTTHQPIWQTKVAPDLMGRVMALLTMVGLIPQLIANVLAGLAVDHVFQPLVGRDEVKSSALTVLIGDGPGRGIALLTMLIGLLIVLTVAVGALFPRLRHLEEELPDAAPAADSAPADSAPAEPALAPALDVEPVR